MENKIKRRGYMWTSYGYTKTHIWGVHIVSGLLAAVGAGALTASIMLINEISSELFYKLISISICAFVGCIATIIGSIFSLLFYYGAEKQNLLEDDK